MTIYANPTERSYPDPRQLPPQVQPLWAQAYQNALEYYGAQNLEGSDAQLQHTAAATAWKSVNVALPGLVFPNPLPQMKRFPDPGAVILLGKLIEYVVIAQPPELDIYRFDDPPDLLWSDKHRMLVALPNDHIDTTRIPCLDEICEQASQRFDEWSKREARGQTNLSVPAYPLEPIGVGDSIVYRSDKWGPYANNGPKTQQYIHQFGDQVWVLTNDSWPGGDENPDIVVAQGGKLDMEAAGIVN